MSNPAGRNSGRNPGSSGLTSVQALGFNKKPKLQSMHLLCINSNQLEYGKKKIPGLSLSSWSKKQAGLFKDENLGHKVIFRRFLSFDSAS